MSVSWAIFLCKHMTATLWENGRNYINPFWDYERHVKLLLGKQYCFQGCLTNKRHLLWSFQGNSYTGRGVEEVQCGDFFVWREEGSGRWKGICHQDTEDLAWYACRFVPWTKIACGGCLVTNCFLAVWHRSTRRYYAAKSFAGLAELLGDACSFHWREADVGYCRQPSCWYAEGEALRGMHQRPAPVLPGLPEAFLGTSRRRDAVGEQQCFFTLSLGEEPSWRLCSAAESRKKCVVHVAGRERTEN